MKIPTIYFAKTNPNAIIPTKRNEDSVLDIYPCFEDDFIMIHPHTTAMIPTGIASVCNDDFTFILKERGSIVDNGFKGEWKVPITNTTDKELIISKIDFLNQDDNIVYPYNKAICQAILTIIPKVDVKEITYDELKAIPSERKGSMLGSTEK